MLILTDSVLLSLPLPIDSKETNLILSGNNVIVETVEAYLDRVKVEDRYLGLEVIICSPPGTYHIDTFSALSQLGTISYGKYKFINTSNGGLSLVLDTVVIIDDLVSGGSSDALSAEQGKALKTLIDNQSWLSLADTPTSYVDKKGKTVMVNDAESGFEFVDRTYVFDQGLPSTIWTVNHPLKKYPSVVVKNSAGDTVEGFINYVNENSLVITFNSGFSGKAILN